jgi:hypothetical protein
LAPHASTHARASIGSPPSTRIVTEEAAGAIDWTRVPGRSSAPAARLSSASA